jgi:CubicO group peptidase (beta-lactamase class C family)
MLGLDKRIRTFPTYEVTRRNRGAEVDPASVGLDEAVVDEIWRSVERLYETRHYPAIGLCIRRRGRVLIDGVIGHERGAGPDDLDEPLIQATPNTLFSLFSASKAITAIVVHYLDDKGLLQVDDRVAEYIPEFGRHGKDWVTIKHVLTHRAGIPSVPSDEVDIDLLLDWDTMIAKLCEAKPTALPGRRLAYHALTGGFILAEIVRRVSGRDIRDVLEQDILRPIGINSMSYGVPPDRVGRVARNAYTGPPSFPPFSWLLERALGVSAEAATELSNDPRFLTSIVPSGNIICTGDECCRFFEMLLRGGTLDGMRVLKQRTIHRAVANTSSYLEFDLTLGLPVRYGMGFMLGAERLTLYGQRSPRAFGHLGFTGVVCYADPERDLSVSFLNTGKPFVHTGIPRWLSVMNTIARLIPRDAR